MKYYDELYKLGIFTIDDVNKLVSNIKTSNSIITRMVSNGYIQKVRNGLYVCNNLKNKMSDVDRYVIASNINKDSYIAYHSALEFHGLNNQTFFNIYVVSEQRFNNFEFEGITYERVNPTINKGVIVPKHNDKVKVTDVERTIIDCIDNFNLAGGLEELYQCMDNMTIIDNEKLLEYLNLYSKKILYRKAGFIFEQFKQSIKISDKVIKICLDTVNDTIYYMNNKTKAIGGSYIKRWNIIVPKYIDKIFTQGV